jgi:hypothetical protein
MGYFSFRVLTSFFEEDEFVEFAGNIIVETI